jgi:hypothetical protein
MIAFWDTVTFSIVEVDRRFGGPYCFHHQDALFCTVFLNVARLSYYFASYTEDP